MVGIGFAALDCLLLSHIVPGAGLLLYLVQVLARALLFAHSVWVWQGAPQ